MPAIERPLPADVLSFDLEQRLAGIDNGTIRERSGVVARTLGKSGALRVTLVVLGAGAEIPEYRAEGPITVQPVRGRISIRADGREHELGIGDLLSAGKAVAHSVRSKDGAAFLLTLTRSIDDADG